MHEPAHPSVGAAGFGPGRYRRLWRPELAVAVALMAITASLFAFTDLDLAVAGRFHYPDRPRPFFLHHDLPWSLFYRYAAVPLAVAAVAAFVVLGLSFRREGWRRRRVYAVYVLCALALGPGVLVNGVLKEYWGRPRPRQVTEFGGRQDFRPVWPPAGPGAGKSFPCGHSSAGYFFMTLYFLWRRRAGLRRWFGLALGLALGTAFGLGRLLSGSHFASDVLWSAYLVFLVSWALYYFVFNIPGREDRGVVPAFDPARERRAFAWGAALVMGVFAVSLLAVPYDRDFDLTSPPLDPRVPASVRIELPPCDADVVFGGGDRVRAMGRVESFGWYANDTDRDFAVAPGAGGTDVRFSFVRRGLFTEFDARVEVRLPAAVARRVRIDIGGGELRVSGGGAPPDLEVRMGCGRVVLPAAWRDAGSVRAAVRRGDVVWTGTAAE
jgi:membrane-associated PAP2 superfamily phosphatase